MLENMTESGSSWYTSTPIIAAGVGIITAAGGVLGGYFWGRSKGRTQGAAEPAKYTAKVEEKVEVEAPTPAKAAK